MLNAQQNEDVRHAIVAVLATRYPAAISPRHIARNVKKEIDFTFTEEDVTAALELLREKKLTDFINDELGSTKYWRATSECVLKHERGDL